MQAVINVSESKKEEALTPQHPGLQYIEKRTIDSHKACPSFHLYKWIETKACITKSFFEKIFAKRLRIQK